MKIIERVGSVTDIKSGVIVHGCNAQGVMGSGVAKALRAKWPKVFDVYSDAGRNGRTLDLGSVTYVEVEPGLTVVNGVTQFTYGRDHGYRYMNYEAIYDVFNNVLYSWDNDDIHFPLIGCGLGGGNWNIVSTIITEIAKEAEFKGTLNLWILDTAKRTRADKRGLTDRSDEYNGQATIDDFMRRQ